VKVSRFYVLLSGAAVASYGVVYFRQDQPHIDLFVFFSVFFSCFFLFLAACVLLWKAKQALDRRRSRHRRQIEMHDMASRPFAAVLVHVPPPPRAAHVAAGDHTRSAEDDHRQWTGGDHPRRAAGDRARSADDRAHGHSDHTRSTDDHPRRATGGGGGDHTQLRLSVLAVQPTRSQAGVVATLLVQLPGGGGGGGGGSAPVQRACLGSCLLTPRSLQHAAALPPAPQPPAAAKLHAAGAAAAHRHHRSSVT